MTNSLSPEDEAWEAELASLCRLQSVSPEAVVVGGKASALYAGHRFSFDHDHVIPDLRERFDAILTELESVAGWETARVKRPVLILGSLDGVEPGVRQLRRARPLETTAMRVGGQTCKNADRRMARSSRGGSNTAARQATGV